MSSAKVALMHAEILLELAEPENQAMYSANKGSSGKGLICYTCGGKGHSSKTCPSEGGGASKEKNSGKGNAGASSKDERPRGCWTCGKKGHISTTCPDAKESSSSL